MKGIDRLFLRIAVVYVLAGMALGIFMAMSDDHSQMPTHAHMNLMGWASMALYAVVYRVWPETAPFHEQRERETAVTRWPASTSMWRTASRAEQTVFWPAARCR